MLVQALRQPLFKRDSFGSLQNPSDRLLNFLGFGSNTVGSTVNEKSAFTLSAFYNGIDIICNDYAKLPKGIYQKTSDGKGRITLSHHPVKQIIDKKPNQYMVAYNFDTVMLKSAILKGNGYAFIERDPYTARPVALQYIDQNETPVQVFKYNSRLWYQIKGEIYHAEDIVHVPGFSFNGITGVGVITHAANSLGVSLASQNFAGEYYDSKAVGTGVVSATKKMEDDAKVRYSDAFTSMLSRKQTYKVPVLDDGMTFTPIKITAEEAGFLLSSDHGITEVARWLNISGQKLKSNKDVNNSISESLERQHVSDSILPWAIKFQQEYDSKLLTDQERTNGLYTKFNTNSLLSADMVSQADYWSKLIFSGVYTRNEVREKLDINPIDGLEKPLTPVNLQIMEQIDLKLEEIKKNIQNVGA